MSNRLLPFGQLDVPLLSHVGGDTDGMTGTFKAKQWLLGHPHDDLPPGKDSLSVPEGRESRSQRWVEAVIGGTYPGVEKARPVRPSRGEPSLSKGR